MFKQVIKYSLGLAGLNVSRISAPVDPAPANPIRPWETEARFQDMYEAAGGQSLVDPARLFILDQVIRHVRPLDGDFAEIGVYRGGTSKLFKSYLVGTSKHLFLFDTFEGMPETDAEKDWHKKGDFSDTSLERVKAFVGEAPNVLFCPGFFPQTAGPAETREFCFVHVDVDIHRSVQDCCNFFYPRLVPGGVIVFDDYGFTSCPGAKEAVDSFFSDKPECPLYLPTGQALVFRHAGH